MKIVMSFWLGLMVAGGLVIGTAPAKAHPHVWVTSKSEVIYAPDGTITGVRHAWTFDDMFSTYALQGTEAKDKGAPTREELAPLAQTNIESLKDFDYFTVAKADGNKENFLPPVDYFLEYKDAALTLHLTLPLKKPLRAKNFSLEVYDPAFMVDFKFEDQESIKLVGAPADCKMKLQRPTDDTAAPKLDEKSFASGDNSAYAASLASKVMVECP